jgi:formylglycine-generating enzyme required for sulfatase activity
MSGCCLESRGYSQQMLLEGQTLAAVVHGKQGETANFQAAETFVGTDNPVIPLDGEGPERRASIQAFRLEVEAVTLRRFAEFVRATGYVTDSERCGSSSVFKPLLNNADLAVGFGLDTSWWALVADANWRQPEGAGSTADQRLDHPVTQVSWNDAVAFATWVGGRLPTEAEWEHAARGGNKRQIYPWGDEEPTDDKVFCNIWQGPFPNGNTLRDGYLGTAPTRSFHPNDSGIYNLCGNVWEWTADAFRIRSLSRNARARTGQAKRYSDKVLKGGSFLCHKSYCYRYRIAARMGLSSDSAASNCGFRVAYDLRGARGKLWPNHSRARG